MRKIDVNKLNELFYKIDDYGILCCLKLENGTIGA